MAPKSMIILFCSLLMASAAAFDITEILKPYSDYSTFLKLLTDFKLVDEINSRQTITILTLNNKAMDVVTSLPSNVQKELLSLHIILAYYDTMELAAMKQKTALLTTLFQASGQATGQMGFLNYTEHADEQQFFGSAVPGAQQDSNLLKVVDARPYNISVMEVSKAIIPPGLDGAAKATPSAQSNASSPIPAQKTSSASASAPSSGNATAPSSGNAATSPSKLAPAPSGSIIPPTSDKSANAPNSNDASPPKNSGSAAPAQATSPSASEGTSPTNADQTTPSEVPSGSATEAPATATDSGPVASSPVSADASEGPAAGGSTSDAPALADSDKTSSAGTVIARTGLGLLVMGLVLFVSL